MFVITGILESIERDDAVDLIKRHGGRVTQAVSKKTSFVVAGRDPGMSKIEKVRLLQFSHAATLRILSRVKKIFIFWDRRGTIFL